MDGFTATSVEPAAARAAAAQISSYVQTTPLVEYAEEVVVAAADGDAAQQQQPREALHEARRLLREHGYARAAVRIWLKLENLQGIGSFKIRGASKAVLDSLARIDEADWGRCCVVTPSAGNMGQGVACMVRLLNKRRQDGQGHLSCAVVVPEHAPATKVAAMARHGAEIVKVPFDRWWEVLCTSEAAPELEEVAARTGEARRAVFIHPCTNQSVLEGNATCGLEIAQQLENALGTGAAPDAVFVPWGGGSFCCGVGSVLTALSPRTRVVACEPGTAAPMALSRFASKGGSFTAHSFTEHHRPSFVDGCGGKTVLAGMQALAGSLLADAQPVPLPHIRRAVKALMETQRVVAEGAGAVALAAALQTAGVYNPTVAYRGYPPFNQRIADARAQLAAEVGDGGGDDTAVKVLQAQVRAAEAAAPSPADLLTRVVADRVRAGGGGGGGGVLEVNFVCVVSGGCVDADVLRGILGEEEADFEAEERALLSGGDAPTAGSHSAPLPQVFTAADVARRLPMAACIAGMETALRDAPQAMAPLRQVTRLPCCTWAPPLHRLGIQATMPVAYGRHCACKCITVFPFNPAQNGRSAHQGMVLLFDAAEDGALLALADAHAVTAVRTAAASAAATRLIYLPSAAAFAAKAPDAAPAVVVALLGTGEQALQHARALAIILRERDPRVEITLHLWGRSRTKAAGVRRQLLEEGVPGVAGIRVFSPAEGGGGGGGGDASNVSEAVAAADIVCTLTTATEAILQGAWLKDGCHVNAVGACTPAHREIDTEVLRRAGTVYVDTRVAALAEPGDLVQPVKNGEVQVKGERTAGGGGAVIDVRAVSDVFPCNAAADAPPRPARGITLFKSLGFALEDLIAARIVVENACAR